MTPRAIEALLGKRRAIRRALYKAIGMRRHEELLNAGKEKKP